MTADKANAFFQTYKDNLDDLFSLSHTDNPKNLKITGGNGNIERLDALWNCIHERLSGAVQNPDTFTLGY